MKKRVLYLLGIIVCAGMVSFALLSLFGNSAKEDLLAVLNELYDKEAAEQNADIITPLQVYNALSIALKEQGFTLKENRNTEQEVSFALTSDILTDLEVTCIKKQEGLQLIAIFPYAPILFEGAEQKEDLYSHAKLYFDQETKALSSLLQVFFEEQAGEKEAEEMLTKAFFEHKGSELSVQEGSVTVKPLWKEPPYRIEITLEKGQ